MKCLKCGDEFASLLKINGKTHNLCSRKYCLVCSPFLGHNTKKIDDIAKESKLKSQVDTICSLCNRTFRYKRSSGHTLNKCNSCFTMEKRVAKKNAAVDRFGGKCIVCEFSQYKAALCFHHVSPNLKSFDISSSWGVSDAKMSLELDKCVMLCANCHQAHHSGDLDLSDVVTRHLSSQIKQKEA